MEEVNLGCKKMFKYQYGHEYVWVCCGKELKNPSEIALCPQCVEDWKFFLGSISGGSEPFTIERALEEGRRIINKGSGFGVEWLPTAVKKRMQDGASK